MKREHKQRARESLAVSVCVCVRAPSVFVDGGHHTPDDDERSLNGTMSVAGAEWPPPSIESERESSLNSTSCELTQIGAQFASLLCKPTNQPMTARLLSFYISICARASDEKYNSPKAAKEASTRLSTNKSNSARFVWQ